MQILKFSPIGILALGASFLASPMSAAYGAGDLAYHAIPGASPQPVAEGAGLKTPEDLETFLDGVMSDQLKAQHIAGATISVVKDGKLFFAKGYGYADVDKQIPVDPNLTLFRPGSTSKLFTWTAVMQLVEQGKINLDADVNTYLTEFKVPSTFSQPIRVKNLMTHTEGFEDGGLGYLFANSPDKLVPLAQSLAGHIPARVRPPTVNFTNGANASYSNWGTALAGLIVSNVSGLSFDDYIEKNILKPLGMTHSTFKEPLPPDLAPHMSVGYTIEKGVFKPHGFEYVHSFGPAGSLSSTATDMAKFMIAHLQNGAYGDARILKEDTAKLMHGRQFSPDPYVNGSGLGFYETYVNGRRIIGHGGDTIYFHTDLALLPEENVGLFVSYNTPKGALARTDLVEAFMDRYYPARLPQLKPPADFKSRAARYAGSYSFTRHNYSKNEKFFGLLGGGIKAVPTKENTLLITSLLSQEPTQWIEVKPDVFRRVDKDWTIAFTDDANGQVGHIVGPFAFMAVYKLAWYQNPILHYFILGFGALCFIVAIVSAVRNWKRDRAGAQSARRARRLVALVGIINLVFFACVGATFATDLEQLIYAWPKVFYVALAFPLISLPLTAGVLYFLGPVWKTREWGRYSRVQYTVIAVMSTAFLWSLNYWNLIGYKFG